MTVKYRDNGEPIPDGGRSIIMADGKVKHLAFQKYTKFKYVNYRGIPMLDAVEINGIVTSFNLNHVAMIELVPNSGEYLAALAEYQKDTADISDYHEAVAKAEGQYVEDAWSILYE